MAELIEARKLQRFSGALDIRRRAKLEPAQLELLIDAGALKGLSGELIDCSHYLNDMALRSRDFH
jgi:hypothetical protein